MKTIPAFLVLLAIFTAQPAFAKVCTLTIEGTDTMQYTKTSLTVAADCVEIKLTLKHNGKLPKAAMGHNWVLTKTADMDAIVKASIAAGPTKDYLVSGDPKIIAHTKLLSGGESDTITFKASLLTKGGDYTFFCSFPGHAGLMKGKLIRQ